MFQLQHPTKLLYKSNDGSELSISDSYVEKPTLKEIIYYHLIEKPYPEGQEEGKTKVRYKHLHLFMKDWLVSAPASL